MRVALVSIASIVLGLGLGLGSTWAKYGRVAKLDDPTTPAVVPDSQWPPAEGFGHLVVEETDFDFGTVERDETVEHKFVFTNEGPGPIELTKGGTTCMKCTIADLEHSRLAAGESTNVTVSYHASVPNGTIRQTATIVVGNDPQRERVPLVVHGRIASSFRAAPTELVMSKFSVNESKSAELKLFAYIIDDLQILKHEFTNAETADHFAVEVQPLTGEELQEPEAKSGCKITVTVRPGLPLGPLRQKLRLETNLPRYSRLDVPIEGVVDSDLSIVGGREWNSAEAILTLGTLKSAAGAKRKLLISIRGPYRHEVQLSVGHKSEDQVQVTLGEPTEINAGAVVQVPLTIEIPPGSAPVNHLGSTQGRLAKVMLDTTHPDAKQVQLFIQYAVE